MLSQLSCGAGGICRGPVPGGFDHSGIKIQLINRRPQRRVVRRLAKPATKMPAEYLPLRRKLRISRSSRKGSQAAASSLGRQSVGNELTFGRDRPAVFSVIRKDMVQAKHITAVAAVLIAACLSGCGYATLPSDTTASLNSSTSTPIKRAPPATPSASTDSLSATSDKARPHSTPQQR